MFRSAYLKLTFFYVVILLVLSSLFSVWLYKEATRELHIGVRAPFSSQLYKSGSLMPSGMLDAQDKFIDARIQEGKHRVISNLIVLNIIILGAGGVASYWLARRTMEPIEQAMESQNRFTADASHELRTPLTAMKLGTEIYLRSNKKLSMDTKELLESNLEEINRLTKLSEDLLLLAQDSTKTTFAPLRLDTVVQTVVQRLEPLASAKKITLTQHTAEVSVFGDEDDIARVVTILVDNAIKYSPDAAAITVSVEARDSAAILTVKDAGIGIAPEEQLHIFERFYRADSARTINDSSGHGLGLPIAHKIITEHHGSITVASSAEKGSTFTVKLPLKKL